MTDQYRQRGSKREILMIAAISAAIMLLLFLFVKDDIFPKSSNSSSGSRSIGIQALAASLTTLATFTLLIINFSSERRARNSEKTTYTAIEQTGELIKETARLANNSHSQLEALLNHNLLLQESNNLRIRYNLIPVVSKSEQSEFDAIHLLNISSSPIIIIDIRKDDKDYISRLAVQSTFTRVSYIILEPSKPLILLDKSDTSGVAGDSYHFSIGLHYGQSGREVQRMSFKVILGAGGTATIDEYRDTNPSRPPESIEHNSDGSYKRVINKTK